MDSNRKVDYLSEVYQRNAKVKRSKPNKFTDYMEDFVVETEDIQSNFYKSQKEKEELVFKT